MRSLLLSLSLIAGCAGGNYQLKGPNNAGPQQEVTPLPNQEVESNLAKDIFPWVVWGSIIVACGLWIWRDRKSTSEKTD